MAKRRRRPRIENLASFVEEVIPAGNTYTGAGTVMVAAGILESEFATCLAGFRHIGEVELSEVSFGEVTGWKCGASPRIGYILKHGEHVALLNVDPIPPGKIDLVAVESALRGPQFS